MVGAGNKKRVVKLLSRRDYSSVERPQGQPINAAAIVAAAVAQKHQRASGGALLLQTDFIGRQ